MPLPAPLSRRNVNAHKNDFGHVLILAGSPSMLGAAALTALAAMRFGAGLVTVGVPKSVNLALQKKVSNTVMTWPLEETKEHTLSLTAFQQIKSRVNKFSAIALGPGLTTHPSTRQLILKIIRDISLPLVIDADALNALPGNLKVLTKQTNAPRILTPHPGEMGRLTGLSRPDVNENPQRIAVNFAKDHLVVLLLKGHRTIVASPEGKVYVNKSGNVGMATAGSGDVLTGMIAAFLGQGISAFDAARWGAYLHGKAGDIAVKKYGKPSLIASDIIDAIPSAIRKSRNQKLH